MHIILLFICYRSYNMLMLKYGIYLCIIFLIIILFWRECGGSFGGFVMICWRSRDVCKLMRCCVGYGCILYGFIRRRILLFVWKEGNNAGLFSNYIFFYRGIRDCLILMQRVDGFMNLIIYL